MTMEGTGVQGAQNFRQEAPQQVYQPQQQTAQVLAAAGCG